MLKQNSNPTVSRVAALIILGAAASLPYLPGLRLPLLFDDFNTLYQAALTLKDPSHFLDPWEGGVLRYVPKIWFILGLELWGTDPWPYRLVNIGLHALSSLVLASLVSRASESRIIGLLTGLLFAIGFGAYGRAVLQISNITMVLSLCALLTGFLLLQQRRLIWAGLALAVAVLSHELAWLIVVLIPYLSRRLNKDGEQITRKPSVLRDRQHDLRLIVGGSIIFIVITSLFPGFVFEISREMVRLMGGSLLPINSLPSTYASSGMLETVNRVLVWIVSQRWWIGLLPLTAIAVALPRLNSLGLISIVWTLAAALPTAILMATWEGEYIDRRYLYFPSVGLAVLGAHALCALRQRRLWTAVLFSAACSWSILWVGFGLWKMTRDAADPVQQANQESFRSEMGALSPKWDD